jgi:CubicO group peptidase (beta-lactamase class C family)
MSIRAALVLPLLIAFSACGESPAPSDVAVDAKPKAAEPKPKASPHDAAIRGVLEKHFDEHGPGAAVLVSRDGEPESVVCYGLADVETRKPITRQSVFDLASVSKHFTAAAALLLIDEGKMQLDDPVRDVLPEFRVKKKGRDVTIGDLVHHVSGLADYTSDGWDGDDDEFERLTSASHVKWLNTTRARRAPGKTFEYNNSGYALLGRVVEHVSGTTFSRFARQRLFEPAGMRATVVHDRLEMHGSIPALVSGYKRTKKRVQPSAQWTRIIGDGNVLSSIEDLARWDRALRGDAILSPPQKERAWTSGTLDNGSPIEADDAGSGYGFGWYVDDASTFHTGSWYGTSTYIVRYRSGLTIVVLSNDENADVMAIAGEVEEIVSGR